MPGKNPNAGNNGIAKPPPTQKNNSPPPTTASAAGAGSGSGSGAAAAAKTAAPNGYAPKRADTQLEAEGNKLTRSNSVHIRDKIAQPMSHAYRKIVGNGSGTGPWKDGFKVAVFSQEASRNFSTKYHQKIQTAAGYKPHSGNTPTTMPSTTMSLLASKIQHFPKVTTYNEAFPKLFENRENPQVIAVVEGKRENLPQEFTLPGSQPPAATGYTAAAPTGAAAAAAAVSNQGIRPDTYKLHKFYIQGKNSHGHSDDKQSMHFYIRDDMSDAISLQGAVITAGFTLGEIMFETGQGKYSVLVPHIPNKIAAYQERAEQLLENYAERVKAERTVIGYIGDTNFKKMAQDFSSPSIGGNSGDYLTPASSGATKFTYFMQANTLGPSNDSFAMEQARTLNHVELQLGAGDKRATDHPSMQTTVLLNSDIRNRKYRNHAGIWVNPDAETDIESDSDDVPDIEPDAPARAAAAHNPQNTLKANPSAGGSGSGSGSAGSIKATPSNLQNPQQPQPQPQPLLQKHSQPHMHPHLQPQVHTQPHPQTHMQPHPQPHMQPHPQPHMQPHPQPHMQPHPQPHMQPHPQPHMQPHPQPHMQPQPHPQPHMQPHPQPHMQPHPQTHMQPHPQTHVQPHPQPHVHTQPQPNQQQLHQLQRRQLHLRQQLQQFQQYQLQQQAKAACETMRDDKSKEGADDDDNANMGI
ncbi:hypothetical protein BN59_00717 [Legionella massiliensis]|uniref:Uncharacterized protein n=2 Tax=Legionella massiliensis TaxID=1034943 RepID=A0A078KXK7_9GAMM|nr:hypothetical protein BN59_00717 [Legionella massiliensis]CEE12186.1 hypothetical protein BN1094_00717 [Legionella massiliensis]